MGDLLGNGEQGFGMNRLLLLLLLGHDSPVGFVSGIVPCVFATIKLGTRTLAILPEIKLQKSLEIVMC